MAVGGLDRATPRYGTIFRKLRRAAENRIARRLRLVITREADRINDR